MVRYSDEDLESLLNDTESDLVERKESWKGDAPDTGRQAVCAFANDLPGHRRPGVLFVGAKNDGTPSCLSITDELLRTLSDIRTDGNILPPPSIVVDKRTLKGCEIAVVAVQPSDSPPVRYKGRIWVRIGPRRAIASAHMKTPTRPPECIGSMTGLKSAIRADRLALSPGRISVVPVSPTTATPI